MTSRSSQSGMFQQFTSLHLVDTVTPGAPNKYVRAAYSCIIAWEPEHSRGWQVYCGIIHISIISSSVTNRDDSESCSPSGYQLELFTLSIHASRVSRS